MLRIGISIVTLIGLAAMQAPASAKELIYGSGIPARSENMSIGIVNYLKDIEAATNKSLTIRLLAGSQVVTLNTTLAGLRDGTVDMGFVVPVLPLFAREMSEMSGIGGATGVGLIIAACVSTRRFQLVLQAARACD